MRRLPQRAFVALGSNLGERGAHLRGALEALRATPGVRVLHATDPIETEPVGGPPGQRRFLNAVVELETTLAARALLGELLRIERTAGRVRAQRNGPRTLDLDLLFYGEERIDEPGLIVPHPRLEERVFVLRPLAQLAPDRRLSGCRLTVRERLAQLEPSAGGRERGR